MLQSIASQKPAGVHLVDAPLIGGVRYAAEASLTVLLAGTDEAVALTEPILGLFGKVVRVGPLGSGVAYKLITNVVVMAAEAGLREALDLTDILGRSYKTTLDLLARGPMAAVVKRALDRDNPRAIRDSAIDFDVLVSAGGEENLPISARSTSSLGRRRSRPATSGFLRPDHPHHSTSSLPRFTATRLMLWWIDRAGDIESYTMMSARGPQRRLD
jgi:3-hydroxyisobutyrate dehydrogenase